MAYLKFIISRSKKIDFTVHLVHGLQYACFPQPLLTSLSHYIFHRKQGFSWLRKVLPTFTAFLNNQQVCFSHCSRLLLTSQQLVIENVLPGCSRFSFTLSCLLYCKLLLAGSGFPQRTNGDHWSMCFTGWMPFLSVIQPTVSKH